MIGKLTGILSDKNPPEVIVDCHGVGYEVNVPMSTFYNLPATGEKVSLVTHFVVREDAQILYGFATLASAKPFASSSKFPAWAPARLERVVGHERDRSWRRPSPPKKSGAWSRCPASAKKPPSVCCWSSKASWAATWAACLR
jgi:hypothetical protein